MSVGPVVRDAATAAFFDGTAAGQLLLRCCPAGHFSEPSAAQCTTCTATNLRWVPAAGGATLISWAITEGQPSKDDREPRTVLVIAELDEGPWWWSQLADADPAGLAVGTRLQVAFRRADGEHETVPVFVVDPRADGSGERQ